MKRIVLFIALVLAVVALVNWMPRESVKNDVPSNPIASMESQTNISAPRGAPMDASQGATRAKVTPANAPIAPLRLYLHAPSMALVGESFESRIDVEAYRGIGQLLFTVTFPKSRLALAGWSHGEFARQGGVPAELGADEPSDGNIEVSFKVQNGLWVAGSGTLITLRFEAIKPGTSAIELRNISVTGPTGTTKSTVDVSQAGVVRIQ